MTASGEHLPARPPHPKGASARPGRRGGGALGACCHRSGPHPPPGQAPKAIVPLNARELGVLARLRRQAKSDLGNINYDPVGIGEREGAKLDLTIEVHDEAALLRGVVALPKPEAIPHA